MIPAFHWTHLIAIACGGAIGAMGRYSVVQITSKYWNHGLPLGTLLANVIGCFIIGLAFVIFAIKYPALAPQWRSLVVVGFLGAFTTFSSYALEALTLIQQGQVNLAVIYLVLSVCLCLLAVASGYYVAKALF